MKTNVTSKKQANELVKSSKQVVKQVFNNPFAICKQLNSLYNGKSENIAGFNVDKSSFMQVCRLLLEFNPDKNNKKPFDCRMLSKNSKGVFCQVKSAKSIFDLNNEVVSIDLSTDKVAVLVPVSLSVTAYYNVFASIVKTQLFTNIENEKQSRKESEKQSRREADFATVAEYFGAEYTATLTPEQVAEKAKVIRKVA